MLLWLGTDAYVLTTFFNSCSFMLSDAQPSRVARSIMISPRGAKNEVLCRDWLTSLIKHTVYIVELYRAFIYKSQRSWDFFIRYLPVLELYAVISWVNSLWNWWGMRSQVNQWFFWTHSTARRSCTQTDEWDVVWSCMSLYDPTWQKVHKLKWVPCISLS